MIVSQFSTGVIEEVYIENDLVGNNLLLIEDTRDLINPFNDENPSNPLNSTSWATFSQFNRQSDGITYGGTGANISYEFVTQELFDNINSDVNGSPYIRPNTDFNGEYTSEFSDTYSYAGGGNVALDSMKSPYLDTLFVGYSRGEVYRFGIVFYDRYGYPSYTYWIGDIKFPFAHDADFGLTEDSIADTKTKQLGIRFSLDTSKPQFHAIKDKISGWSYVRVRRDLDNRTRLGTGFMQPTWYLASGTPVGKYSLLPFEWGVGLKYWAFDIGPLLTKWRVRMQYQAFYSPNFLTKSVGNFIDGDYIRMIGRQDVSTGGSPADFVEILRPDFAADSTAAYYLAGNKFT